MHLYCSLLFALVATSLVLARIDDSNENSDAEELPLVSTSTVRVEKIKLKSTVSKPNKNLRVAGYSDNQHCGHQGLNDEKDGYYCGQISNGLQGRYGIRFYDNDNFYCGEFNNGEPNGKGYMYYADQGNNNGHYCGDIVDSKPQGYGSYQFFATGEQYSGRYHNGVKDGAGVTYWAKQDTSAKGWYTNGACTGGVWYNSNGLETSRKSGSC